MWRLVDIERWIAGGEFHDGAWIVATTVCCFLLDGQERRHRAAMIGLLEDVHMARGNDKSFDEHFAKVDIADLQKQWESFVQKISIRSE